MSRPKIRHLVAKQNADGTWRFYWQPSAALAAAGWRTRRLDDNRGAAIGEADALNGQVDAWRAGTGAAPAAPDLPPANTVRALIHGYKQTRHWLDLDPNSRRSYGHNLKIIEAWIGDDDPREIEASDVQDFYEAMRGATPTKAVAVVRMTRIVWNVGLRHNLAGLHRGRDENPAEKPGLSLKRATEPMIWPREAAGIYIAAADALGLHSVGDMVAIGEWLGHYASDLIALRREHYRDGVFRFHRAKTGAYVPVPHSPNVAARVEAALARQEKRGIVSDHLILNEATGRPYADENAFGKKFRLVRAAVAETHPALGALWFMWLRHTAIVRMAEAGCIDAQIGSVTGHSLKTIHKMLDEHYFQPTETLARQATDKRLKYEADSDRRKE